MRKMIPVLTLAFAVAALAVPALAHHGAAAFDTSKTLTLKGTVTAWIWSNPHCLLQFDVTGDDGKVVHWVGETQNPVTMVNGGWSKFSFKTGDKVTITMQQVKNGTLAGRIMTALLPSGANTGPAALGGGLGWCSAMLASQLAAALDLAVELEHANLRPFDVAECAREHCPQRQEDDRHQCQPEQRAARGEARDRADTPERDERRARDRRLGEARRERYQDIRLFHVETADEIAARIDLHRQETAVFGGVSENRVATDRNEPAIHGRNERREAHVGRGQGREVLGPQRRTRGIDLNQAVAAQHAETAVARRHDSAVDDWKPVLPVGVPGVVERDARAGPDEEEASRRACGDSGRNVALVVQAVFVPDDALLASIWSAVVLQPDWADPATRPPSEASTRPMAPDRTVPLG